MKTRLLSARFNPAKLGRALRNAMFNRTAAIEGLCRRLISRLSAGVWTIYRSGAEVEASPGYHKDGGYPVAMSADMGAGEMSALASLVADAI